MSAEQQYPPQPLPPGYEVATIARRLGSRGLEFVIGLSIVAVFVTVGTAMNVGVNGIVGVYVLYAGISLTVQLGTGATMGQLVLGLRNLDPIAGRPSGPRTLGKYLLMGFLGQLTCGLAMLIALVTIRQPGQRTFFDRWLGVVVVRRRTVPIDTPARYAAPPTPVLSLALDTGLVLSMDQAYVLGRNPAAPDRYPDAAPRPVPDETRSLSKTHVLVAPAGDRVEVIDLHSTNGVTIRSSDGASLRLVAGEPAHASVGARIDFGRRSMEVRS